MNCLLIDLGSSFIKYEVYDESSEKSLFDDKVPFPDPKINDGARFTVDTAVIIDRVLEIFESVRDYRCKKVFFSVQMHGYILKNTDGMISDYVSWRDKSGSIADGRFSDINFNLMGTSLKANLPLVKLLPQDVRGEFFTLGSYIVYKLTGKNATHITDACASGFFFSDTGKHNGYCNGFKMPTVSTKIDVAGKIGDIVVYVPMGDHQISYLGSEAETDRYLLNIGTATQLSCVNGKDYPDGVYEKRPYFDPNKRLYTISGLVGGDMIFKGQSRKKLLSQIKAALSVLPPRKGILLGGGGAEQIYDFLKKSFADDGIDIELIETDIGTKGLEKIAMDKKIKAGTMLSEITFANFPVISKKSGLDFIIIDNEHGAYDYGILSHLVMNSNLCGMNTVVRIGDSSRGNITKLADMGVHGFLLPMTNCAEDIKQVVKYAKYKPVGQRGVSTTRAHTLYDPPSLGDYMVSANNEMRIYAQIETKSGVDNIDEILSVNGVDGAFIGPNDLSVDLDCVGDKEKIYRCIETVSKSAQNLGKLWGIITTDNKLIDCAINCGVDMISFGSELNMLIKGCKSIKEMF